MTRSYIDPETAAELRALQGQARTVNGVTPDDDPRRAASVELAVMLAALNDAGVSKYALAKACGVTQTAIAARLQRFGHRPRTISGKMAQPYGLPHKARRSA